LWPHGSILFTLSLSTGNRPKAINGDNFLRTVEILQYTLRKGTGTAFHTIMQEISVPLHQRHGIDVVSFGNSLHDPDCYYLIRAFDSAESMTTVYASAEWRNGPPRHHWQHRNQHENSDEPAAGKRERAAGAIVGHLASPDAF
jgi:hypothetical protein